MWGPESGEQEEEEEEWELQTWDRGDSSDPGSQHQPPVPAPGGRTSPQCLLPVPLPKLAPASIPLAREGARPRVWVLSHPATPSKRQPEPHPSILTLSQWLLFRADNSFVAATAGRGSVPGEHGRGGDGATNLVCNTTARHAWGHLLRPGHARWKPQHGLQRTDNAEGDSHACSFTLTEGSANAPQKPALGLPAALEDSLPSCLAAGRAQSDAADAASAAVGKRLLEERVLV